MFGAGRTGLDPTVPARRTRVGAFRAARHGSAASALMPLTSSTVSPIAPPTISNRSLVLAKSTAILAAATGSVEVASAVGPVSRSPIGW